MNIALFLLSAVLLYAEPPLPALRIEVDGEGCALFIRNNHNTVLTAYWIEQVNYPGSWWYTHSDSFGGDGVAPGDEIRTWVKNQTVCAAPEYVKMRGAIYSDGALAGAADRLIAWRKTTLANTREGIRRLEAGRNTPKQQLAADISAWQRDLMEHAGAHQKLQPTAGIQTVLKVLKEHDTIDEAIEELRRVEQALLETKPPLEQ